MSLQVKNKQCLQRGGRSLSLTMKIVRHHDTGRFDWLISGHQSVNPLREEFLYCLANTKDLRLSNMCILPHFKD